MAIIYESKDVHVIAPEKPHVSRSDGGHIVLAPRVDVEDRTKLSPEQAIELMKLTMVVGEAMKTILAKSGIDLGRINYQDNGNWTPSLHIHLYGRAKNAIKQKYSTPLVFPATLEEFNAQPPLEPLTSEECEGIKQEIIALLATDKYKRF